MYTVDVNKDKKLIAILYYNSKDCTRIKVHDDDYDEGKIPNFILSLSLSLSLSLFTSNFTQL